MPKAAPPVSTSIQLPAVVQRAKKATCTRKKANNCQIKKGKKKKKHALLGFDRGYELTRP